MIKIAVIALLIALIPALTAMLAGRSPGWKRIIIACLVFSFIAPPLATFDYQLGFRHVVRGWEICITDLIAIGCLGHALLHPARLGSTLRQRFLHPITWALGLHSLAVGMTLLVSCDQQFSAFYLCRYLRGLLVFVVVSLLIRQSSDLKAIIIGMIMAVLCNEYQVLVDRYSNGRFQCLGMFDHQNNMGMYMILIGPILVAILMWRAFDRSLMLPLLLGIAACAHSVSASLSRASMLGWGLAVACVALFTLCTGIDRYKMTIIAGASIGGLLACIMMFSTIQSRVSDEVANNASKRTREVMNLAAQDMHRDRFLFGWGINTFATVVNREPYAATIDVSQIEKGHRVDPDYRRGVVESMYLLYRAETGAVGFATFLFFIACTMGTSIVLTFRLREPLQRSVAVGICFAFAATYVQLNIEHTLMHYSNMYAWMTWSAVLVALPLASVQTQAAPTVLPPCEDLPTATMPEPSKAPRFWT